MTRPTARQLFAPVFLAAAMLTGCASTTTPTASMNTIVQPGQAVLIKVDHGDGRVQVTSSGPGHLVVRREDAPSQALHAGSPGDIVFTTHGNECWKATNESGAQTSVEIRVSGVEHAEIAGPVVPPPR
ncbi:MAG: hypothetical protein U0638_00195 [Phycisphaerales bacterium]